MTRVTMGALALASGAILLSGFGGARADTIINYNLPLANCLGSAYCASATNFGTVVVDINTLKTSATITYTLTTGLIDDGILNDPDATFSMTGASSWSAVSNDSSVTWSNVSNGTMDPLGFNLNGADPGSAFGSFAQGVVCSNIVLGTCGNVLTVTVLGTNLGVTTNSNGYFAAIDTVLAIDPLTSPDGAVATSATPLPGALPLFGTVLGAGFIGLRRRRRTALSAAAT